MSQSSRLGELSWIAEARTHIGLREVPGPKTNSVISGWLTRLKAWWSDDATPWCGTFAAMCVADAGLTPPKDWYRATAWLSLPVSLPRPAYGCVVVFPPTQHHQVSGLVLADHKSDMAAALPGEYQIGRAHV